MFGKTMFAVAAATLMTTGASAANLLANGDFSAGAGNTLDSWIILPLIFGDPVDPLSIRGQIGSDYIPCCGANGSPGALANRFASFGPGDSPNTAFMAQLFTGSAGATYDLTFDTGAIGGPQFIDVTVFDLTDGSLVLFDTIALNSPTNNFDAVFSGNAYSFTVSNNGLYTVQFSAQGSITASADAFLDNVSVTSVVPEPASWAMMIGGFGLVGGALRRRRVQTSVSFA